MDQALTTLSWPLDLVMLGMGEDGHVASLFPRNPALAHNLALPGTRRCIPMEIGPDGLPPTQPRMSLTLSSLRASRQILIYITGAKKWRPLQRAFAGEDTAQMPVRALLNGPIPVRVVWAP